MTDLHRKEMEGWSLFEKPKKKFTPKYCQLCQEYGDHPTKDCYLYNVNLFMVEVNDNTLHEIQKKIY